ncbi:hypothetical protein SELMODRAFT_431632 [Selaginella moellendorffii]|uniref:Uncharacterized protein n=1 Tax=Selaginella moellendorffii TaxID=88036 RepID=D8TDA1_SELML|nr:hypothetical protein SELMODRAFT_431632 [Selaginella moellendorffii]
MADFFSSGGKDAAEEEDAEEEEDDDQPARKAQKGESVPKKRTTGLEEEIKKIHCDVPAAKKTVVKVLFKKADASLSDGNRDTASGVRSKKVAKELLVGSNDHAGSTHSEKVMEELVVGSNNQEGMGAYTASGAHTATANNNDTGVAEGLEIPQVVVIEIEAGPKDDHSNNPAKYAKKKAIGSYFKAGGSFRENKGHAKAKESGFAEDDEFREGKKDESREGNKDDGKVQTFVRSKSHS